MMQVVVFAQLAAAVPHKQLLAKVTQLVNAEPR